MPINIFIKNLVVELTIYSLVYIFIIYLSALKCKFLEGRNFATLIIVLSEAPGILPVFTRNTTNKNFAESVNE